MRISASHNGVERPRIEAPDGASDRSEARAAVLSAAALFLVGAALTGTAALLPDVSSPAGVVAIAVDAVLVAAGLVVAVMLGRGGLGLAWVADLWGAVLVALLCAATGGAHSPFALIYFFAIGHAAAFQPRARVIALAGAVLLGFLAPLAYESVSTMFAALACVGMVLALMAGGVVYVALNRMRGQRTRLELLIAATARLDSSLDPAATLRRIAATAVPELADLCVIDVIDGRGSSTSTAAGADPALAAEVERLRAQAPPDTHGGDVLARALRAREPCMIRLDGDGNGNADEARSDRYRHFMREIGAHSAALIPMVARGRTRGAISFLRTRPRARYRPAQMAVLEDLTARAAMAYDNARLYAERARIARTLRRSLMPADLPVIPGMELACFFRPLGAGDEVGGDFFDVLRDELGCWLVVGDVCGKGAEAAVLTGFLRHTTIAYARESGSPANVLEQVNQAMLEQDFGGRFATVLLGRLTSRGAGVEARVAAAGHPAALVARAGGRVEELGGCGTLLGVFPDPVIEDATAVLAPGDVLTLYTDGLADAHAPQRTVTVGSMIEQLERRHPDGSQETIESLLELVDLDDSVRDDIAILAAGVKDGRALSAA